MWTVALQILVYGGMIEMAYRFGRRVERKESKTTLKTLPYRWTCMECPKIKGKFEASCNGIAELDRIVTQHEIWHREANW